MNKKKRNEGIKEGKKEKPSQDKTRHEKEKNTNFKEKKAQMAHKHESMFNLIIKETII